MGLYFRRINIPYSETKVKVKRRKGYEINQTRQKN